MPNTNTNESTKVYLRKVTVTSGRGGMPSLGYAAELVDCTSGVILATTRAVDGVSGNAWIDAGERLAKRRGYTVVKSEGKAGHPFPYTFCERCGAQAYGRCTRSHSSLIAKTPPRSHAYMEMLKRRGYTGHEPMATLAGIEELRAAVAWADSEPEYRHDNMTAEQILARFRAEGE